MLSSAARAEARAAWQELESRVGDVGIVCSWAWTGRWLEHYGDVVRHRFLVGEQDGGVCGVVLVAEQAGMPRWRPPTIVLGTAGEPPGSSVFVERNRLLVAAGAREPFARALLDALRASGGWERLRLDGVLPEEAEQILGATTSARWQVEESPIADLRADGGDCPLAALPARRRRRLEAAIERLGEVQLDWATDAVQAREILDELIVLHQARWEAEGERGAFRSPRFTGFHRDLVAALVPEERAALVRMRRGEETLACLYGLIEGQRLLYYQGGAVRPTDNKLRVGLVGHALFMRACYERGLREYDFLAPAARYKSELSNRSERLAWVELDRPGPRLMLERAGRSVKRRLRRIRGSQG